MLSKDDLAQNTDKGIPPKDSGAGEGLSSETANNPPAGSCQYSGAGSMPFGGLILFLLMGILLISRRKSWRPE